MLAQDADSDRLRLLTKSLPQLRLDRVELKTNPSRTFEGISAVRVDRHGNIYVLHPPVNGDPVVVLDPRGRVLRSWGAGMFTIPHGIRVGPAGNVWTVDAHTSMVYKFTAQGRKLLETNVGNVPDTAQDFCGATDVAFGPHGRVFGTDGYCNARVIEFGPRGKKVREWGPPDPGQENSMSFIQSPLSRMAFYYVADRENGRLQWFDLDGKFLGEWRSGGQLYSVAFSAGGGVYVSTHPKGVPLDDEFNVFKIDPVSGQMLGRISVRAHATRQLRRTYAACLPATESKPDTGAISDPRNRRTATPVRKGDIESPRAPSAVKADRHSSHNWATLCFDPSWQ